MNDMEAQIDYLTMEVDYLEDKIDDMMLRIKSKNNESSIEVIEFDKIFKKFFA